MYIYIYVYIHNIYIYYIIIFNHCSHGFVKWPQHGHSRKPPNESGQVHTLGHVQLQLLGDQGRNVVIKAIDFL